jgi:hypothetical protein
MTPDEAKFILWNSRREAAQPASEQVGTDEPSGEGVNPNPDLQELLGRLRADLSYDGRTGEVCEGDVGERLSDAADAIEALLADLARKDAALLMIQCLTGDEKVNAEARQALETKAGGAS